MPDITISDLKRGDIIVFLNRYYKNSTTIDTPIAERYEDADYEDHIAMFSHFDESNHPVIVHCIDGKEGYSSAKPSGIVHSTLRKLFNQTDTFEINGNTISRRYDVDFIIFRCTDERVALSALTYFNIWNNFDIPYDTKRLEAKLKLEDEGFTGKEFYKLATEQYHTTGKFRALKYAVRRQQSLTQGSIKPGRKDHGLTCSMALVLAFQVAELEPYVTTLQEAHASLLAGDVKCYNSDKHALYNETRLTPLYVRYLQNIGNTNTPPKPTYYVTSLQFCKEGFNIDEFTHRSFPIDCKCIGVAGIVHLFRTTPEVWQEVGELRLPPEYTFTQEQKIKYKAEQQKILNLKQVKREAFQMEGHYGSELSPSKTRFVTESLRTVQSKPKTINSVPNTPERRPIQPQTAPHTNPRTVRSSETGELTPSRQLKL